MTHTPNKAFYEAIVNTYQANKILADRAIEQVSDIQLHQAPDEYSNSIAIIMKHIAGNLISRWTDSLATDGEKPNRNRDSEFVDTFTSRKDVLDYWEQGWALLLDALEQLSNEDPQRIVYIRGEPHKLALALSRSLGHTCFHIGQIVQQARSHAGVNWKTLSIEKGKSEEFNRENWGMKGRS